MARGKPAGAGGRTRALTLIGGEKPQMRRPSASSWTRAKEELFLSVLAETCNVTRACAAAGVGVTSAYRRRKEYADFRSRWLAAVAVAYQQLELLLLERAFQGVDKLVTVRGGEPVVMREYSNQLGLALLKMHRDCAMDAETELVSDEIEEMRERLIRKLQRMKEREQRNGDRRAGD